MQNSIETRWFLPGLMPSAVTEWFQHNMAITQPARVDTYLCTPQSPNLGIKLREGRVEIKQRSSDLGVHTFHPDVIGVVESWQKWSFMINSTESVYESQSEFWIDVKKDRVIRRYSILPNGDIKAVPGWLLPLQRSSIEITNIILDNASWWSLGFEVVGNDINLLTVLLETTALAFESSGFPPLPVDQSYSYPHWLELMHPYR